MLNRIKSIDHFSKRLCMCILGVAVCGISVGFFKRATFGVDPFQNLIAGLDACIPLSFGTVYVIANVFLFLFALIFDRHYIGIATIINLFFLGYIVDFSYNFLLETFPDLSIPGRIACFAFGILILCLSSSFYFTADLGVSTYDAIALIMANTWKVGQFRWIRILTDLACVIIGLVLYCLGNGGLSGIGAIIGVGTIITAFFMGPLIDLFNKKIAEPFLYR